MTCPIGTRRKPDPAGPAGFILEAFPFTVQRFHSGNGSEYINYRRAAAAPGKLHIKLTKLDWKRRREKATEAINRI